MKRSFLVYRIVECAAVVESYLGLHVDSICEVGVKSIRHVGVLFVSSAVLVRACALLILPYPCTPPTSDLS